MKRLLPDFYRARIDLEVRDVKHVSQVVTMLNAQTMEYVHADNSGTDLQTEVVNLLQ